VNERTKLILKWTGSWVLLPGNNLSTEI